jgi:flagellar hook-associated protein 3 FlgL
MSMRLTTTMISRNVLSDLNDTAARLNRTRSMASSGKALTRPSDNPYQTARALDLRESLEGTRQYQRNISDAQGWQESSEQALSAMTEVGNRARDLVVSGGSDTSDPVAREATATEIDQLIEAMKEHANTTYAGRFVFGGTQTTSSPYQQGAVDTSSADGGTIAREIGPGVSLVVNTSVDGVLGQGGADGKMLSTLRKIAADLRSGNGASLRGGDLKALDDGLDELMSVRAENGAKSNRLDGALSRLQQYEETTTSQLSETEDADFAQTMIDLNSQQAAYQAALSAGAKIVQQSLMDFLR